jgi:2-phospho-L-lactate guanylyltransferase (CobY/MobA/RfbA family)
MSRSRTAATRPTLLVFALGPEADSARRPVQPRRLRALERDVRAQSLAGALEAGRACGCELELASGHRRDAADVRRVEQRGAGFGERLRSALAGAWERHPDGPLVVVGGDIPGLAAHHVEAAVGAVRRDRDAVVVGPSPDGGFYLLASARPLDGALAAVRWCGASARADLLAALERLGRPVVLLEPLADLDRPRDVAALLAGEWSERTLRWLAWRIREALRAVARPLAPPAAQPVRIQVLAVRPRRGPPR